MKTSSGDVIKMDFANAEALSMSHQENSGTIKDTLSFSSMQSFQFSIESNGIDKQDKKEINAFMKIAQPFIDGFLKELEDAAPKSPVTELARTIAGIFEPSKERSEDAKNQIKTNIVGMFDNSMAKLKTPEKLSTIDSIDKIFKDAQKLLEKTLQEFNDFNKKLYA
jgi:hypothetical protein